MNELVTECRATAARIRNHGAALGKRHSPHAATGAADLADTYDRLAKLAGDGLGNALTSIESRLDRLEKQFGILPVIRLGTGDGRIIKRAPIGKFSCGDIPTTGLL